MNNADPVMSLGLLFFWGVGRSRVLASGCVWTPNTARQTAGLIYSTRCRDAQSKVIWTAVSISPSAAEREPVSSDPPTSFRD